MAQTENEEFKQEVKKWLTIAQIYTDAYNKCQKCIWFGDDDEKLANPCDACKAKENANGRVWCDGRHFANKDSYCILLRCCTKCASNMRKDRPSTMLECCSACNRYAGGPPRLFLSEAILFGLRAKE